MHHGFLVGYFYAGNAHRLQYAAPFHFETDTFIAIATEFMKQPDAFAGLIFGFEQPFLKPGCPQLDHLVIVQGYGRPDTRFIRREGGTAFFVPIPMSLPQLVVLPDHDGEGLNIIQVNTVEGMNRAITVENIQENEAPAFTVGRLVDVLVECTIEQHHSIAIIVQRYPCASGLPVLRE
jgi:hypothetical protein